MTAILKLGGLLVVAGLAPWLLISNGPDNQLDRIKSVGELRVGILPSPAHYIVDNGAVGGVEYDLINDFASSINVRLKPVPLTNLDELNRLLRQGGIHIGVPGSTVLQDNPEQKTGPAYGGGEWYLVYNRDNNRPEGLHDVARDRLIITPDSRQSALLGSLQSEFDDLRWREDGDFNIVSLLEMISARGYYYTLIDSDSFDYFRRIYPRLDKAFSVDNTTARWLFPASEDSSLYDCAQVYFDKLSGSGEPGQYAYFVGDGGLDYLSSLVFLRRIDALLPQYRYYFESAALRVSIDWRLLAAISYQESNWDPQATSFTGVRGLMMLTQTTAQRMGIRDRLDPHASISGGADYLALLMASLPKRLADPDRLWLALAAYNVGLGHLEDARILTEKSGKNPDKWDAVKQFLPLLADPQWYEQTKHGRARGGEPVKFVEQIQQYYDVLRFYLIRHTYAELERPDILLHPGLTIRSPVL